MSDLRDLYQQVILDHQKKPRNFRVLEAADRDAEGFNPLCGDKIHLFVKMENGVIKEVGFQGTGCAISTRHRRTEPPTQTRQDHRRLPTFLFEQADGPRDHECDGDQ